MKYIILIITLSSLCFPKTNEMCDPARPETSDLVTQKEHYIFVKGYFIPHDGSKVHLAKFKVVKSTDDQYQPNHVYPVYEHGPFGNQCEMMTMGESPLDDELCGQENIRYLIVYKEQSNKKKIVAPIFHGQGLVAYADTDELTDVYHEKTTLSAFESYIFENGNEPPIWSAVKK